MSLPRCWYTREYEVSECLCEILGAGVMMHVLPTVGCSDLPALVQLCPSAWVLVQPDMRVWMLAWLYVTLYGLWVQM